VIEIELAEIEDRLPSYPPQAQADIRRLAREVRKLYNLGSRNPTPPTSAIYDPVTGLPSVGAFGVRFAMARARASRNKKLFAVMSIELSPDATLRAGALDESLKERMLKEVATRLTACVRETDTVARVDEEKFALILEDLATPENAQRVEQKVRTALDQPLKLGDQTLNIASTLSLQFYPSAQPVDSSLH